VKSLKHSFERKVTQQIASAQMKRVACVSSLNYQQMAASIPDQRWSFEEMPLLPEHFDVKLNHARGQQSQHFKLLIFYFNRAEPRLLVPTRPGFPSLSISSGPLHGQSRP
jgi:hypothetical protein